MEARHRREPAKCRIARARKPQLDPRVAGVVLTITERGRGTAPIRFSEELVEVVGEALPQGVSQDNPAFLKLIHDRTKGVWRLYASYLDRSKQVFLWEYATPPAWLPAPRREQ